MHNKCNQKLMANLCKPMMVFVLKAYTFPFSTRSLFMCKCVCTFTYVFMEIANEFKLDLIISTPYSFATGYGL